METDEADDSDSVSIADSVSQSTDLYSLEDIDEFLEVSFARSVELKDYFPDVKKFITTVKTLQKDVGTDALDERKRFRLRKHVTAANKVLRGGTQVKRLKYDC